MDKQKLIDKAVESKRGLIGEGNAAAEVVLMQNDEFYLCPIGYAECAENDGLGCIIGTVKEFTQRAKELGLVNGYQWGVEYPTNGKKPNLPDYVVVDYLDQYGAWDLTGEVYSWNWPASSGFKIVDSRYKPKETTMTDHVPDASKMVDNSWHERGELPPVGVECEASHSLLNNGEWTKVEVLKHSNYDKYLAACHILDGTVMADTREDLRWFSRFRPIKSEREKFVDAAMTADLSISRGQAIALYDAGFRAPEEK